MTTRGMLQYHPKEGYFSVLYSRDGYAAIIEGDEEIMLVGVGQWAPVRNINLFHLIGEEVEIRNIQH